MPLDDDQDPMPPAIVTVRDPTVTGVEPVPDDSPDDGKETYNEAGLSGEASINTHKPVI
jgi:hypothetical protein